MRHTLLSLFALATACATTTPPPPRAPTAAAATADRLVDPTPHTRIKVDVAPDITLEVLDYGGAGTGTPIVFLAGLGNSAHVFDDFAPAFTAGHRVVAITRRGFPDSTTPPTGYDVATRIADDLAVADHLHLAKAIWTGHSIAGDELTAIAAAHPERVAALVYLDAHQDHVAGAAVLARAPKIPPAAPPPDALRSGKAFAAWMTEQGNPAPIGEWAARLELGPHGEVMGFRGDPTIGDKILAADQPQTFAAVHVPALAIIAGDPTPAALGLGHVTPDQQAEVDQFWPEVLAFLAHSQTEVATKLAGVKLVVIPHSQHYVFLHDRAAVIDAITAFLPR